MSKPITLCVFCGRPGATKGHVWPKWMINVLPNAANKRINAQGMYRTFAPDPSRTTPYKTDMRQGRGATQKLRNTCLKCNGGWMSVIEGNAKPALEQLIRGKTPLLDETQQKHLSSLICLVTIRAEFMDKKLAVSDEDREVLRLTGLPPDHWRIWIARFWGIRAAEYWHNRSALQLASELAPAPAVPAYNTQASTFVWGQLVAASVSSSFLSDIKGYDGQLARIWPVVDSVVDTGLLPLLNDSGVASLGEALAREYMG